MRWFRRDRTPSMTAIPSPEPLKPYATTPGPIPPHWPNSPEKPKPPEKPLPEYKGTRYRICTETPSFWWVEEFLPGEGMCDPEWRIARAIEYDYRTYRHRRVEAKFNTKAGCKEFIDRQVLDWQRDEQRRLDNLEHVAANPPEEYP